MAISPAQETRTARPAGYGAPARRTAITPVMEPAGAVDERHTTWPRTRWAAPPARLLRSRSL